MKTRRRRRLRRGEPGGLRPSCRLVSSHPPPLPRADGNCTHPHPGLARQHRAAASQISLCRVLSLLDCCAHDLGLLPPFQTPYAWQRRLASLRGECYCVQLTVLRCHIQLSSDPVLKQCQSLRRHILAVPMQGTKGWTPANANASKQPFLYVKQCGETRKN
jgi:hypothetical protein